MKDERPQARFVKPGEMLAMDPSRIHRGPEGFFWMMGSGLKPNERRGDVAIVHIRGELEHHKDRWGYAESYEGIIDKLSAAASGEDAVLAHEREHRWDVDYEPIAATPPKRIEAMIDSPGGVVAGLNECHAAIVKLIAANPDIEFEAYVNEMAASAAYALACAFPTIRCPRSAILGSIGVISTMISQARKNKKDGFDVELLTSGARKADGHLHAPISEEAKAVEMDRVMKLAKSFWRMVSKARGLPIAKIEGFEAGIFLGPDAVRRGLADAVMSFDDVLLGAGSGPAGGSKPAGGGNQTDRRLRTTEISSSIAADRPVNSTEPPMLVLAALIKKTEKAAAKMTDAPKKRAAALGLLRALQRTDKALAGGKKLAALIQETEAAVATETDEKKLSTLLASLDAYKKTEKHIEHTKSEEGDDEDEEKDDEDEEEDDEEDEAKKAKAATSEEDDEEEATSEEDEAKAALAAVHSLTGLKGNAALGALQALAGTAAKTAADVAQLKRDQRATAKATLIAGAREKGQITKAEAAFLRDQTLATVKGFVEMRRKGGFVVTGEEELLKPKHVQPGTEESLPAETLQMIEAAVNVWTGDKKSYREELVKAHLAAHAKRVNAALNGAGRY